MSIDLDKPRYDQSTYTGRAKHFLQLTNPLNVLASDKELDEAKNIVTEFRKSRKMPPGYDEEKLWRTKYLYDSAFHPDTGEKMFAIGRMSAQAPMNTIITGCMITFYKTTAATVFWQWVNQTFNAVVNYTNRSGDAPLSKSQLLASYCAACGGALGTALYLNNKVKNMKPIYARLVPFAAVCGANFINIPMMRSNELMNGTPLFTPDGQRLGDSKRAAAVGIGLVCVSRVLMAVPGMTLTPMVTNYATRRGMFCRYPLAVIPFQLFLVGLCVTFATPLCCALFEQRAAIGVNSLEEDLQEQAQKKFPKVKEFYFNKGL
ncbi:sideroflexin-1-3 [Achroia grisella]|uniref:sideroflexin-1-3 n=1 Tax=Achroia grisella TaxID=688607 RepID=UPI0027D2FDB1|nr:sideroflexin-1-3 [Achroia grisella]XP_059050631.1 sideroflexin-1-3 [Achroia grisella]